MNETKQTKKECPFRKDLDCEKCKFFLPFPGGGSGKRCLFESLLWHITGIDIFKK